MVGKGNSVWRFRIILKLHQQLRLLLDHYCSAHGTYVYRVLDIHQFQDHKVEKHMSGFPIYLPKTK